MSKDTFEWTGDLFCEYLRSMGRTKTLEDAEADFCANTGMTQEALQNAIRGNGCLAQVIYVPEETA